ncbi:hypothetical protein JHK85_050042 [Glycine max]|nr:hypothetical protein JHK85_050042 [Glycine max]
MQEVSRNKMYLSKCFKHEVVFILWFCCYLLHAAGQNNITDPVEVDALRAIKSRLIDPNGNLSNWNDGDPCTSRWKGVLCFNETKEDGHLHVEELLLNGNKLTGSLPEEIGYLPNLDRIQIDQNQISGPIPTSFANLNKTKHFLLDNNNLSGYLPRELADMPSLLIIQLDNNNFEGNSIPDTYANMSKLLKIDLSSNRLTGNIPSYFADLPRLQKLLNGNPLCSNVTLTQFCGSEGANVTDGSFTTNSSSCPPQACPPPYEYSVNCFCGLPLIVDYRLKSPGFSNFLPYLNDFEVYMASGVKISTNQLQYDFYWQVGPRLRMNLKFFPAYVDNSSSHTFNRSELLRLTSMFTGWLIPDSDLFGPYELMGFNLLGPYQDGKSQKLLCIFFSWMNTEIGRSSKSGISTGALVGIVIGAIAFAVTLSAIVTILILRIRLRDYHAVSRRRHGEFSYHELTSVLLFFSLTCLKCSIKIAASKISIKIDGVRAFSYGELSSATNNFSTSAQVGQGGYGKVYKGVLSDGTIVAIKRAQEGSLQGEKEFLTEISLLSRLHHRNLVSLIGYCDEEGEQMLVYEFMSNGTLRDHLSVVTDAVYIFHFSKLNDADNLFYSNCVPKCLSMLSLLRVCLMFTVTAKDPLTFAMRLKMALGAAKGLLYLHSEADPPIFHRDVKASNILLDSKFSAKVADFGLSRLAPVPDMEGVVPGHVSTVVKGTPGYLDPEYFLTRKLTDKSDVYSLGVVFLELLTGMHPISHGKNIVREVNVAYQSGVIFSIIDGRMGSYPSEHVEKFLTLAMKCCEDEPEARPRMAEVVRELENIWSTMPESDTKRAEFMSSDSGKADSHSTPSSSSASASIMKTPFVSGDVSGSDLVSGGTTLSLLVSLFFLYENISDDGGGARTKARSCGGMMVLDTMVRTQGAGGAGEESRARGSEVGNDIQHRW